MPTHSDSFTDSLESRARELLPHPHFDYFASGAGNNRSIMDNRIAFQAVYFIPRVLRPVANVDTSVNLGSIGRLAFPVLVAPMAMQKLAHSSGEIGMASASAAVHVPYVLSTFSTSTLEEVVAVQPNSLFQIYVFKDRAISQRLLKRAHSAGFKAVVLTVDAPVFGRREHDKRNNFNLPSHL